jgi:hypothetical protein
LSHVAILVLNLLELAAVVLILRKMSPHLESLAARYGMEELYHRCAGAMPVLIMIGVIYSVLGFVLTLVLKAVVK